MRWQIEHQKTSGPPGPLKTPARDPSFPLSAADLEPFRAGRESALYDLLGAHPCERDGAAGTRFAVWAPRAEAVSVVGAFNAWEAGRDPMSPVGDAGVWELFLPGVGPGALYKYHVRSGADGTPRDVNKADPMGRAMEVRPGTASRVVAGDPYPWMDRTWLEGRRQRSAPTAPVSIYEVHLGSWRRHADGSWLGYRALARELLPYVADLGFTHVELLPVTEHPYDASWGYQTVGYFAPTSRYGTPDDFAYFVDKAHRLGLGVVLDWVPGHFGPDLHGLRTFDGAPLYEMGEETRAVHPDWGTLVFDFGRPEVVSFLLSSARYWIERYHVDGLRVDAVASMLHLDYSREAGQWEPNELGGRENLGAIAFLKTLAKTVRERFPGVLLFAEESSAWPGITASPDEGGLGFDFKWNMGWMNDTLRVLGTAPERRPRLHTRLTFSLHYAHQERHLLPLSHDEVVHLKRPLLEKMPGPDEEKFATLRLLLGYMWTHPGAKLLFMGGELGQRREWDEEGSIDWELLDDPSHRGIRRWVRALNEVYVREPALHALDHKPEGFEWLDVHDARHSVLSYVRWRPDWEDFVVAVANFSATAWPEYRVALPAAGTYQVLLDSGDPAFGGGVRTQLPESAEEVDYLGRPAALTVDLPPLGFLVLQRTERYRATGTG
ncbi:1,4-alpha-glucan branching protein GlgB [Candidatus Palauibacter sp.]|uniref:1,4-alpha-glucan branching protein GlgB n=1 Tax=Candidatus Palauibacter sp. TaxID=3101350 RepID=UPI003AF2A5B5